MQNASVAGGCWSTQGSGAHSVRFVSGCDLPYPLFTPLPVVGAGARLLGRLHYYSFTFHIVMRVQFVLIPDDGRPALPRPALHQASMARLSAPR